MLSTGSDVVKASEVSLRDERERRTNVMVVVVIRYKQKTEKK